MGSPVSPIIANLYMEYYEQKTQSNAPSPRLWHLYVDDTFVIQKEENKQNFLQHHIHGVDLAIQFTVENKKDDGTIPFLDTIVKPETVGKLSITVYRKPTHKDQYLQWDSFHHLSAKYSVISTLTHRAKSVCSNPELLQKKWSISGKHLLIVNTSSGFGQGREKTYQVISEVSDGASSQGTAGTQSVTMKLKTRVI